MVALDTPPALMRAGSSAERAMAGGCDQPMVVKSHVPRDTPSARSAHTGTLVPAALVGASVEADDALIVFGGFDGASVLSDAHVLPLPRSPAAPPVRWRRLDAAGPPPEALAMHGACLLPRLRPRRHRRLGRRLAAARRRARAVAGARRLDALSLLSAPSSVDQ